MELPAVTSKMYQKSNQLSHDIDHEMTFDIASGFQGKSILTLIYRIYLLIQTTNSVTNLPKVMSTVIQGKRILIVTFYINVSSIPQDLARDISKHLFHY